MLGLSAVSCTTKNLLRTGECTLNLASDEKTANVNAIAKTTGSEVVPEKKAQRGYVHCKDKFGTAKLTEMKSKIVQPPGIEECPVSMEAKFVAKHEMWAYGPAKGGGMAIEVEIVAVSVHEKLRMEGYKNRINPDAWKPMIMMFSHFYGLREGKLVHSRLAEIDEEMYRMPGKKPKEDKHEHEDVEQQMANGDVNVRPGSKDHRVGTPNYSIGTRGQDD